MAIFFDMDGVLATYHKPDYLDGSWLETGYFRNRPVNDAMIAVMLQLDDIKHGDVYVLSKILDDPYHNARQHLEKRQWLDANGCYTVKLLTTGSNKADCAKEALCRDLTQTDILIDDYNDNLEDWAKAGGCGVKYGLGDPSTWGGHSLHHLSDDVADIINLIAELSTGKDNQ